MKCDFSGWATVNDLKCADGRIIRRDAFKECDGKTVPLVWHHRQDGPENVLGHALLENTEDGVRVHGFFNKTASGQNAKELVQSGDIVALSIAANQLREQGPNVMHGVIKEVSLVYAPANPKAYIDTVEIAHSETGEGEVVIIYTGEPLELAHSDDSAESEADDPSAKKETVEEVIASMSEQQQNVLWAMVGKALGEDDEDDNVKHSEGGEITMKHNVFDNTEPNDKNELTHADLNAILEKAKGKAGSLKAAFSVFEEENDSLAHGIESIETLFPEFKDVRPGAPELLTTDQGWIGKVLQKVHKSPISRIRTRQADIRDIEKLRARGYKKGTEKKEIENFKLIYRTTEPTTVYVKSKIDRDDIIDVVDFDVVQYLYGIDRMNLNEELATAIMFGDGREDGDEGKIAGDKIRPVWLDDDLYTLHADVDIEKMKKELQGTNTSANFGENYIYAESVIQTLLYTREKYKGSGKPDFYCTPHLLNVMLLARDLNGRRIYDNVNELCAALNVGEIITVEQMEGKERTDKGQKKHKLLGIMVNLADYSLGATKGGEITHFTDFDIDFNQQKSLLETRCSGANTRVFSAIALEEPVAGE